MSNNEGSHLLLSDIFQTAELKNVMIAQYYIPDEKAICCSCIPSLEKHKIRAKIGITPVGKLKHLLEFEFDDDVTDKDGYGIFTDDNRRLWRRTPWYCNMCNKPWKQTKLVLHDEDLAVNARKAGSTEIQVIGMSDEGSTEDFQLKSITYNYRDKSMLYGHFWADIFPVCLYCSNPKKI